MAVNQVKVTMKIRNDTAAQWAEQNPVLAIGEYGLENDTLLLKIGDGVRTWNNLPYLNKLNSEYFKHNADGTITASDSFAQKITDLEESVGQAITDLVITDPPVNDTDAVNKKYVDDEIAAAMADRLSREVVETLPDAAEADANTLYMVPNGNHYDEYLVVNGAWETVGSTGDGTVYELPIATDTILGGVKSSTDPNYIQVTQ